MTRQPALFARSPLPASMAPLFEQFWAAYPRRRPNPRAEAEAEFARAVRAGVAAQDLVQAAGAYAALCKSKGTAEDFIVHAATFVRKGRWRDFTGEAAQLAGPAPTPRPPVEVPADAHHPLAALRPRLTPGDWRMWILPLDLVNHSEGEIALISAPSRFHAAHVRAQHYAALKQVLRVKELDILAQEDIQP
jgi:hypothetical protein